MAGLNIQATDVANKFIHENPLVPVPCQHYSGGSSNPPKFGTLIPNRIFVGGIPSNTTEQELKSFFSTFGQVKDVKIINDRLGVSKGSYGFVTFESQEMAEKVIKNEQMLPRPADIPATLYFTGGSMASYSLQNGMAVYPVPGQEYPLMTQSAASYATMMLPQQGAGTALYLPTAAAPNGAAATGTQFALPQHATQQHQANAPALAALQQQYHPQTPPAVSAVAPPGATNGLAGAGNSTSAAAVMAAAAAAMAAYAQWPSNGLTQPNPNAQSLTTGLPGVSCGLVPAAQQAIQQQTAMAALSTPQQQQQQQQQQQALAAAVVAQQQAWRWSPCPQNQLAQQVQQTPQQLISQAATATPTSSVTSVVPTGSPPTTLAMMNNTGGPQQSPAAAPMGPTTYLYSPIAGAGHELMFFHQNTSPYATNSTSDYGTDHSAHSSSMLESVEHLSFMCDVTPPSRNSQQLGGAAVYAAGHQQSGDATSVAACMSPYGAIPPLMDVRHAHASQPQAHPGQLPPVTPGHSQPHLIPIPTQNLTPAGGAQPLISHIPLPNTKMYAPMQQQQHQQSMGGGHIAQLAATGNGQIVGLFGGTTAKQELNCVNDMKLEPPQTCAVSAAAMGVQVANGANMKLSTPSGNGITQETSS